LATRKITTGTLARRLKQARTDSGLSQRVLGLQADLDPSVASARINQYERQTHTPNYEFVKKLAKVLKRPAAFFYATEDELADLISLFGRMSTKDRALLLTRARRIAAKTSA